jgi:hypothetical protein
VTARRDDDANTNNDDDDINIIHLVFVLVLVDVVEGGQGGVDARWTIENQNLRRRIRRHRFINDETKIKR